MKDDIKEIKIGMYTTDEILEFMTDGEGRGFMGRSMYDAILDYITNLNKKYENAVSDYEQEKYKNNKAIEYCRLNKEFTPRLEDVENILQGSDK